MDLSELRANIKRLRQEHGLRASDMADRIGISRPYYTQLERGTRKLSVSNLIAIAGILRVSIGELCGEGKVRSIHANRTFNHVRPINNRRLQASLKHLVVEPPDTVEEWQDALFEVQIELAKLKKG